MTSFHYIQVFLKDKAPALARVCNASNPILNSRDLILFFSKNKDLESFSPYYISK
jgi:hypothetical protein